jgi:hypothetical protein
MLTLSAIRGGDGGRVGGGHAWRGVMPARWSKTTPWIGARARERRSQRHNYGIERMGVWVRV